MLVTESVTYINFVSLYTICKNHHINSRPLSTLILWLQKLSAESRTQNALMFSGYVKAQRGLVQKLDYDNMKFSRFSG